MESPCNVPFQLQIMHPGGFVFSGNADDAVFCPGFQKGRVPSQKGTFSAVNGLSKGHFSAVNGLKRAL